MSIVRGPRPKQDFTYFSNSLLNDELLSADALGVLVYLLSKPDNWQVMPSHLQNRFDCGKDRIYRILGDLQKAGYASIQQERGDDGSFIKNGYVIHEKRPLPENPEMVDQPCPVEPLPAHPLPENPPLQSKDSTNNGTEQRTDSNTIALRLRDDWPADYQIQWWKIYPRKHDKKNAMKRLDAIAKSKKVPWAELVEGTEHYASVTKGKEEKYIKHPATFLNGESWRNRYNRNHERAATFMEVAEDFWNGQGDGAGNHHDGQ